VAAGGGASTGGGSTGGSGGGSGGGTAGGGSTGGGSAGGGASGGGSGGGSDGGSDCGGIAGLTCSSSEFCLYTFNKTCGGNDDLGMCTSRPTSCQPGDGSVCGCDGHTYSSECAANLAGVDVSESAACTTPAGTVRCGPYFCPLGTSYCQDNEGGIADHRVFSCQALPGTCGSQPSCSCLPNCGQCTGTADAGLIVTCFLP
jgi:hypothetical protein